MGRVLTWLHRSWTFAVRAVLRLASLAVILVCLLLLILQLKVVKSAMSDALSEALDNQLAGNVTFERLEGFLPFTITLGQVGLDGADASLTADEIRLRFDLRDLLESTLTIERIRLIGVQLESGWDADRGELALMKLLRPISADSVQQVAPAGDGMDEDTPWWLPRFRLNTFVPDIGIQGGHVSLIGLAAAEGLEGFPDTLRVEHLFGDLYLEIGRDLQVLDIQELSASVQNLPIGVMEFAGQIYRVADRTEFNGVSFRTLGSVLDFSGEVGIGMSSPLRDIFDPDRWIEESFRFQSESIRINPGEWAFLGGMMSRWKWPSPLDIELDLKGASDAVLLDRLRVYSGESVMDLDGRIPLDGLFPGGWDIDIRTIQMNPADMPRGSAVSRWASMAPGTILSAKLRPVADGSARDSVDVRLDLTQGRRVSTLRLQAGSSDGWRSFDSKARLELDSLVIAADRLVSDAMEGRDGDGWVDGMLRRLGGVGVLDGALTASASSTRDRILAAEATLNLQDLAVGELNVTGLSAMSRLSDEVLTYGLSAGHGGAGLDIDGRWDMASSPSVWTQQIRVDQFAVGEWLPDSLRLETVSALVSSALEAGFPDAGSGTIQGVLSGMVADGAALDDLPFSFSVERSPAQDPSTAGHRSGGIGSGEGGRGRRSYSDRLEFRSSIADLMLTGEFALGSIPSLVKTTIDQMARRIEEQAFLESRGDGASAGASAGSTRASAVRASDRTPRNTHADSQGGLDGRVALNLKDLSAINAIMPWLDIQSSLRLEGTVDLSDRRFKTDLKVSDSLLTVGDLSMTGLEARLVADLDPTRPIREDARLLLDLDADRLSRDGPAWVGFHSTVSLEDESMALTLSSRRGGDAVHMVANALMTLLPDTVKMDLYTFGAGLEAFEWTLERPARLDLSRDGRLRVEGLSMANGAQRIRMDGTFSRKLEDELATELVGVDLDQISDLLAGRLAFGGVLDGRILSRLADGIPVVQGDLSIAMASLNDRPIGEFTLQSTYVPESDRYAMAASLATPSDGMQTDPTQIPPPGQDIAIEGFIRNPVNLQPGEPRFDMAAIIRRVDLSILQSLLPNLIVSSEGTGRGEVKLADVDPMSNRPLITGSLQILRGSLEPVFLNATYEADGSVTYDNRTGFRFEPLRLYDRFGGSGRLTGEVAMTHLRAPIPMRLNLEMDRLLFMNNAYDPDIPFYSTIFGTGSLQLSGTDLAPVLRTTQPITVVSDSRVAVPLLDVINPETDSRFVTFVQEFDDLGEGGGPGEAAAGQAGAGEAESEQEFVFLERFTLDLQFQATQPMNFRMIFDPVTNDELSANGTGQIRVTLQNEIFSMFGRMDILSGEYNFVSGDILARRFSLQEGGTILWDGDPIDARLDVSAVYRARPPISTLGVASLASTSDTGVGQRVPIELVLQIFGNISQIQNEFFFQIPTGMAGINDPALNARISSLNRNQEEKLVQAFSILLTGNFIPSGQSTFENTSALQGFTGSAVLINPFVSSQLLSPLLSNQINSLLNENVTFDVDVNIDSYNEVELGVALRLYNDRLVLRREGQITGQQSTIGDIGATYRINSVFSMTAFHRQDPTFTSRSGQVGSESGNTQVINGVGLQARFQFHTWRELRTRFSKTFATLLGRRKKNDQDQEQSETDPSPIAIRFLVPPDPDRTGPVDEDEPMTGASDGELPFTHRLWRQNRLDDVFTDY